MEVHTSDWTIESNVRCTSFAMPFASPHTYTYAPSDINLHKSLACNKINHRKLGCKVHFELEIIIHHWWLQQDSVRTLFAPSQACSIWSKITFLYYIHICKQNTVKKLFTPFQASYFEHTPLWYLPWRRPRPTQWPLYWQNPSAPPRIWNPAIQRLHTRWEHRCGYNMSSCCLQGLKLKGKRPKHLPDSESDSQRRKCPVQVSPQLLAAQPSPITILKDEPSAWNIEIGKPPCLTIERTNEPELKKSWKKSDL